MNRTAFLIASTAVLGIAMIPSLFVYEWLTPAGYQPVIEHCPDSAFSCPSQNPMNMAYAVPASLPAMAVVAVWALVVDRFDLSPKCEVQG